MRQVPRPHRPQSDTKEAGESVTTDDLSVRIELEGKQPLRRELHHIPNNRLVACVFQVSKRGSVTADLSIVACLACTISVSLNVLAS